MSLEQTPNLGPKFKNNSQEEISDTAVYTGSLTLINGQRETVKRRLDSLRAKGVGEDDLEVRGLNFNLQELNDQERQIRESMKSSNNLN